MTIAVCCLKNYQDLLEALSLELITVNYAADERHKVEPLYSEADSDSLTDPISQEAVAKGEDLEAVNTSNDTFDGIGKDLTKEGTEEILDNEESSLPKKHEKVKGRDVISKISAGVRTEVTQNLTYSVTRPGPLREVSTLSSCRAPFPIFRIHFLRFIYTLKSINLALRTTMSSVKMLTHLIKFPTRPPRPSNVA
jgi:hypothetical protein